MNPSWSRPQQWLPPAMDPAVRFPAQMHEIKGWGGWADRKKLRFLRQFAKDYGGDPRLRDFVLRHIIMPSGAQPRDYRGQAAALLAWVQSNVYYANEPNEQIQAPWYTLKVKHGDCDDMSVLLASMAESIRLPWRFVLAGRASRGPARVAEGERPPFGFVASHIYLDLGWPPFSEGKTWVHPQTGRRHLATTWAAAEPTINGVPLGYDAVYHGQQANRQTPQINGGPSPSMLPELAGWSGALAGASMSRTGLGWTNATPSLPVTVPPGAILPPEQPQQGFLQKLPGGQGIISFIQRLDWQKVAIGTLQYVGSGLIIRFLLMVYTGKKTP